MNNEEKYNTIMPQTTDRILCIQIDKPISKEGYEENFLPRVAKMREQFGEIRLLVYYKKFQGWEINAAALDMQTVTEYSNSKTKIALVNAPEKEIRKKEIKNQIMNAELKAFTEKELDAALEWVEN